MSADLVGTVGHGALGLRSGLPLLADILDQTVGLREVALEMRPVVRVETWSVHSGATYTAQFAKTYDNMVRDIVAMKTSAEILTRAESLADCVSAEGTYFYDPETAPALPAFIWDSTDWDDGKYWDQTFFAFVHLTDGANPNDVVVAAALGFYFAQSPQVHPHLGDDKLTDGGLDAWDDATTLTSWAKDGAVTTTRVAALAEGIYACEITAGVAGGIEEAALAVEPGGLYRLSGVYKTGAAEDGVAPAVRIYDDDGGEYLQGDARSYDAGSYDFELTETRGGLRRWSLDFRAESSGTAITCIVRRAASKTLVLDELKLQRIWRFNYFEPRLTAGSIPTLASGVKESTFGGSTSSVGSVSIINSDGFFDVPLGDLLWINQEARLYLLGETQGSVEVLPPEWERQFLGLVQALSWQDDAVTFQVQDYYALLNLKLPLRVFNEVDTPAAEVDAMAQARPLLFGAVAGMDPWRRELESTYDKYGVYELCDTARAPDGIKRIAAVYAYADQMAAVAEDVNRRLLVAGDTVAADITPDNISGANLKLWLNADSMSAVGDGNTMTVWDDDTGLTGGFVAGVSETNTPSWHAAQVNGHAAVKFDKANEEWFEGSATTTIGDVMSVSAGTIFVVFKPISLNTNNDDGYGVTGVEWGNETLVGNEDQIGRINTCMRSNGKMVCQARAITGPTFSHPSMTGIDTIDWHLGLWEHKASELYAGVDEVRYASVQKSACTNNSADALAMKLRLAATIHVESGIAPPNPPGDLWSDVYIAEVLIYDTGLSEDQRALVEAYLANKYGLTPSGTVPPSGFTGNLSDGTLTINSDVGAYEVTSENNLIDFADGGDKVATLTVGLYSAAELAVEAETQMDGESADNITATYSENMNKFTLGSSGGTFTLLTKSGANKEITAFKMLGFDLDADNGGAGTYTSDNATFVSAELSHFIRADVDGMKDDGAGTFTGMAASLIVKAPDIVRVLWANYLLRDASLIDSTSFLDARDSAAYTLAALLDVPTPVKDTLDKLARSVRANLVIAGDGTIYFTVIDADVPTGIKTLYDRDFLPGFAVDESISEVFAAVNILYGQNPANKNFLVRPLTDDTVEVLYGRANSRDIETFLTTSTDAATIGTLYVADAAAPPRRVKAPVAGGQMMRYKVGDKIQLTRTRALDASGSLSATAFRNLRLTKNIIGGTVEAEVTDL